MLRRAIAAGLVVTVQVVAGYAPLVHAHLDDHATDHHGRPATVHAHVSAHAAMPAPACWPTVGEDETERTLYLQLFVAVAAASFDLGIAIAPSFEFPVPEERAAHRSLHVAHGHDPPVLGSLVPRAPPAFLS